VTTEARSERRLKEVEEFMQRPVDLALLTTVLRHGAVDLLLVVRVHASRRSKRRYGFCL
jgi:hypothetical protein